MKEGFFLVVFHHKYFNENDNGCRVYDTTKDAQYLAEYPSQYTIISELFTDERDAHEWCAAQPCEGEQPFFNI